MNQPLQRVWGITPGFRVSRQNSGGANQIAVCERQRKIAKASDAARHAIIAHR